MAQKLRFDFMEFAYNKLLKNFQNVILFERTIPFREIYRIYGLLFRLNRQQTRDLLKDMGDRYQDIELNNHGLRLKMKRDKY